METLEQMRRCPTKHWYPVSWYELQLVLSRIWLLGVSVHSYPKFLQAVDVQATTTRSIISVLVSAIRSRLCFWQLAAFSEELYRPKARTSSVSNAAHLNKWQCVEYHGIMLRYELTYYMCVSSSWCEFESSRLLYVPTSAVVGHHFGLSLLISRCELILNAVVYCLWVLTAMKVVL